MVASRSEADPIYQLDLTLTFEDGGSDLANRRVENRRVENRRDRSWMLTQDSRSDPNHFSSIPSNLWQGCYVLSVKVQGHQTEHKID